jgi:hypothetical protein
LKTKPAIKDFFYLPAEESMEAKRQLVQQISIEIAFQKSELVEI